MFPPVQWLYAVTSPQHSLGNNNATSTLRSPFQGSMLCCVLPSARFSPGQAILLQVTRFPSYLWPNSSTPCGILHIFCSFICGLNLQFIPYNSCRIRLQWMGCATYESLLLDTYWVVGLITRQNSISIPNLKLWWGASILFSLVAFWI